MSAAIRAFFRLATGKSEQQLSAEWASHYFCTRSRPRAYWRLLTA